jgi:hypothetical protein
MRRIKSLLPAIALGSMAIFPVLPSAAIAAFEAAPSPSAALSPGANDLKASGFDSSGELETRTKDDWDDWGDDIIQITGQVVRFGERDENEWIIEANGRRYRVDAGPRWWRNLPVAIGDQLTVEGDWGGGELDAFWVKLANGETVEVRSRSGRPSWAGDRPWEE